MRGLLDTIHRKSFELLEFNTLPSAFFLISAVNVRPKVLIIAYVKHNNTFKCQYLVKPTLLHQFRMFEHTFIFMGHKS